jgi:alkylmercury lyase
MAVTSRSADWRDIMTGYKLTPADLEQMAAATVAMDPAPEPERKQQARALRALLSALAEGRPAGVEELAAAAGQVPAELVASLRETAPDAEWDAEGRVAGFGITLNPAPHQAVVDGHRLYAWCAADALGMMPAIGRTVRVSSACPATGQAVTVTVAPDGVRDTRPPEAVVSVIITGDPDDLRGSVCSLGNFFASPDAASGWLSQHPDGTLLTVPDAVHYARSVMRLLLGS